MAKGYLGNEAIRPMETAMWKLCNKKGYDPHTAFTGLLDYIIGFFDTTGKAVEGWRFDKEDCRAFYEIMLTYFEVQRQQTARLGWYDAFGDLYMALHTKGGGKGQYFTPMNVAQVVAEVNLSGIDFNNKPGTMTPMGRRLTVNDPAAGSGRLALAGYSVMLRVMQRECGWDYYHTAANRPYVSVEDLDYNCVKMAAINLAMHGCYGEAVCHDSLCEPGEVRLGYIVGEADWPFPTGIPSIRQEMDPMRFVCTRQWGMKQRQFEQLRETKKAQESKQLTLW